jgi:hypothetical protein
MRFQPFLFVLGAIAFAGVSLADRGIYSVYEKYFDCFQPMRPTRLSCATDLLFVLKNTDISEKKIFWIFKSTKNTVFGKNIDDTLRENLLRLQSDTNLNNEDMLQEYSNNLVSIVKTLDLAGPWKIEQSLSTMMAWLGHVSPYIDGDFKLILDSWEDYVNQANPWIKLRMMRGVAHAFSKDNGLHGANKNMAIYFKMLVP